MKNTIPVSILTALMIALASCSSASGTGPSTPKEKAAAGLRTDKTTEVVTIRQVIENAVGMNDQPIELAGSFRGWKGCLASTMITRSDWVMEDETGCIYVTGSMPEGVSAENAKGERIQVTGRVVVNAAGRPTVRAERAFLQRQ